MPVYTRFIDKFDLDLATALSSFEANFKAQSIFDSMSLEIKREGAAYPEQVMQDADYVKNFDCFTRAVSQAPGQYGQWCDKYENIVYFKLTDYTAQDVNVLATQALEVEKVDKAAKNSTMKVSRKLGTVRYQRVGRDIIQNYPAVDYETLWQVSFALEDKITHARAIWFVQDDQEERKDGRRRLTAAER